jgi:ABC-type uncharacterized transport system substrate-binding protein
MQRREFITLLGGAAAAWPLTAHAQQPPKAARIGYLSAASAPDANVESVRQGMLKIGYVEGRDFVIETRYAERDYDKFPALIEELLRAKVDLIVTGGPATEAAPLASRSVSVVFGFSGNPVDAGIVKSFARPDANATGISFLALDIAAKRVEILKEASPTITRLAVLSNPEHAGEPSELRVTREAARNLGLEIAYFPVRTDVDFEPTFGKIAGSDCNALVVFPDALMIFHRQDIGTFAKDANMPTIFGWKPFVEAGGLMSYGPNLRDSFFRLAFFIDKILKGTKPNDIPIEQPTKLELVINLKTAKVLGLTVPAQLLTRADEVIE